MIPLRDNIPSSRPPVITVLIIIACVIVFVLQVRHSDLLVHEYGFDPSFLLHPDADHTLTFTLLTILTSMFMHGGLMHIIGNMWFLWIFGDNVEDRMGHARFLVFYLLCGAIAAVTQAVLSAFAPMPSLGASGAIAGVLGAYFILFRGATVRALVPIIFVFTVIDVPAWIFLGLWFVYQFFSGVGSLGDAGAGGVAFWAHVGGFVAGLILVKLFAVMYKRTLPQPRVLDVRY